MGNITDTINLTGKEIIDISLDTNEDEIIPDVVFVKSATGQRNLCLYTTGKVIYQLSDDNFIKEDLIFVHEKDNNVSTVYKIEEGGKVIRRVTHLILQFKDGDRTVFYDEEYVYSYRNIVKALQIILKDQTIFVKINGVYKLFSEVDPECDI